MKVLMIVLDDWENKISGSSCWDKIKDRVDILFINDYHSLDTSICKNVSVILTVRERSKIDESFFMRFPRLQLILQTGGHAYHIDLAAAKRHGVSITMGRMAKSPLLSVPELVMAMMLSLFHKVNLAQNEMRMGNWPLVTGRTLSGKRLGILGMGRHGSRVADIARKAFDMEVIAWDRGETENQIHNEIPRRPLHELLMSCDVVSIHLRLSDESKGIISGERIALMKRNAILINTARGAMIDEDALIGALQSKKLGGAGLDVFVQEPLARDSPLRSMENVIITPHIGWTVEEVFEEFAQIACGQLETWLDSDSTITI